MKTTDAFLFLRNMKRVQYICAGTSVGIFVLFLMYMCIGGNVPEPVSTVIFSFVVLTASASAVTATVIRYKNGRHFAYSTFFAFFFFSLIYVIFQHTVTFVLVIAALSVSVCALAFGVYSSRKDKFAAAKYIGILIGIIISFFSVHVGGVG